MASVEPDGSDGLLDLLRTRRSIRKYEPRPLEPETVALLEEALLRAPSSRGRNPWQFVLVDDPELLAALAKAKPHGSSFLRYAPFAIVICGDEQICDVWVEDCTIAAFIAHLAAHSLGLGSCWIQIRCRSHDDEQSAEQYVQELLGVPAHLKIEAIVAVGHPVEAKPGHELSKLEDGKIHRNRYA